MHLDRVGRAEKGETDSKKKKRDVLLFLARNLEEY